MKRKKKNLFFFAILVVISLLLFSFREIILMRMGSYLAPEGTGKADAVILEGTYLIKWKAVEMGLRLLSSGQAGFVVVVVNQDSESEKTFALPNYPLLVSKNLEALGLKENQFEIIETPSDHPITLTAAKIVLPNLSRKGIKRAILLSQGFHMRRSYWAYKQVGSSFGIEVIPQPYFIKFQKENWWQEISGAQAFYSELLKFMYYLLRGYIPLKSVYAT